jgi:hypothetical protein
MSIVGEVVIEDSFFHIGPVSSTNLDDFHSNHPIVGANLSGQ